jgi:hypothetical protein
VKRYLITIIIGVIAVTGMSSYYVFRALDEYPQYKIVTTLGDSSAADQVVLSGDYRGRIRTEYMEVSSKGSNYQSDRSFIDRHLNSYDWFYEDAEIAPLVKEYRNFMRGKTNKSSFYQDEEWLIYAMPQLDRTDTKGGTLTVQVDALHLESGVTRTFKTQLESYARGHWSYLADVQLIGNELHLLTGLFFDEYQFKDYIIDLEDETFIQSVDLAALLPALSDENRNRGISFVSNPTELSANDVVVLAVQEHANNGRLGYPREDQFLAYQYSTGEMSLLPNGTIRENPEDHIRYHLQDEILTVSVNTSTSFSFTSYEVMPYREGMPERIYTAEELGGTYILASLSWEDRAYVLLENEGKFILTAINLASGDIVYQGSVESDDSFAKTVDRLTDLRLSNITLSSRGQ